MKQQPRASASVGERGGEAGIYVWNQRAEEKGVNRVNAICNHSVKICHLDCKCLIPSSRNVVNNIHIVIHCISKNNNKKNK